MKPEEKARIIIDRMLNDAGWEVVDRNHYSPEDDNIPVYFLRKRVLWNIRSRSGQGSGLFLDA